jgi:hypothetical protein
MNESIKEILEFDFETQGDRIEINEYERNILLNYITNLQEENKKLKEKLNCKEYFSSTMPEDTEFVILTKNNYDRQQKDLALENIKLKETNEEHRKINGDLRKENKELKEKVDQYENPDDYTLFYMWLDTRAKDKMKQMEHEVMSLKQHNAMITKLSENIKDENQKLVKVVDGLEEYLKEDEWTSVNGVIAVRLIKNKLTELKGGSDDVED